MRAFVLVCVHDILASEGDVAQKKTLHTKNKQYLFLISHGCFDWQRTLTTLMQSLVQQNFPTLWLSRQVYHITSFSLVEWSASVVLVTSGLSHNAKSFRDALYQYSNAMLRNMITPAAPQLQSNNTSLWR